MEHLTQISIDRKDWAAEHKRTYLESGGARGHIVDLRDINGHGFTTCLVLKTIGRKTGEAHLAPLIYADMAGEVVIVGSRGGAPKHPAWVHNIRAAKDVDFQIATEAFRGSWREPEGKERDKVWQFMVEFFPPYADYQAATDRQIPLIMMTARERLDRLW
jgi:deazaflavin-dependent oxidoreductase (nitroreductase family)